jgi:hypothetical protein
MGVGRGRGVAVQPPGRGVAVHSPGRGVAVQSPGRGVAVHPPGRGVTVPSVVQNGASADDEERKKVRKLKKMLKQVCTLGKRAGWVGGCGLGLGK